MTDHTVSFARATNAGVASAALAGKLRESLVVALPSYVESSPIMAAFVADARVGESASL